MIELVAPRLVHARYIAAKMRASDRVEVAVFGSTPFASLRLGLAGSTVCWTALKEGRPAAMLGATPLNEAEGHGTPWMLSTAAAEDARAIAEHGPLVIAALHRRYRVLTNWVAADNRAALRMLRWLGFSFGGDITIRGVRMIGFRSEVATCAIQ
jgi:hypothetical protein